VTTTALNDEGRPKAARDDGQKTDHPDSVRQHEPRSRGRRSQHPAVDLERSIGGESEGRRARERAGRFEWEVALRNETPTKTLTAEVKAALLLVATYANAKTGAGAFVGKETTARQLGKSAKTIRRYMAAAERLGWVEQKARPGKSNRYFLTIPAVRNPLDADLDTPDTYMSGVGLDVTPDTHDPGHLGVPAPRTPGCPPIPTDTPTGEDAFGVFAEEPTHEERDDAVAPTGRSGSTEEGDDVFHETPAVEDDGLIATLRRLSTSEARDRSAAEWKRPGGAEIVRYCVERATTTTGLDEGRLVRLLDGPFEVFLVHSGEIPDDRLDAFREYADASAAIDAHRAAGRPAALSVAKGDEALFHIAGVAA
jgi:hypothetical protein